MLTMAVSNELISRTEDSLKAEFLYDRQNLAPNLTSAFYDKVRIESQIEPMF
jgi:hypothetical protein